MSDCKTIVKVRKVFPGNNALLLCLPVDFTRKAGISKGDTVIVSYNDFILTVTPNPDRIAKLIKGEPKSCPTYHSG